MNKPIMNSIIVKSMTATAIIVVCFYILRNYWILEWALFTSFTLTVLILIVVMDTKAYKRWRTYIFAVIIGVTMFWIQQEFLPASWHKGFPSYIIAILVVALFALALLGSSHWFWQWRSQLTKDLNDGTQSIKILDLLFQAVGFSAILIAAVELKNNAESLRTANRVQLYSLDTGLSTEYFNDPTGKFHSISVKPSWGTNTNQTCNASNYCRQLLSLLCTNETNIAATNVQQLYEILNSANTNDYGKNMPADLIELRKTYNVMSQALDEMHFAYDSWGAGVIDEDELATWIGYIKSYGPNPMFLTVIYNWHQKNYMCSNFADLLKKELLLNSDYQTTNYTNYRVIGYFYPQMLDPDFITNLPACGKVWNGWSPKNQ